MEEEEAIPPSSHFGGNQLQHIHKRKLEKHETIIAEAASKKMKLEVNAKNKEMKRLLLQKEEAVENFHNISIELGAVHKLIGKDRDFLKQYEEEECVNQKRIELLNLEIRGFLQRIGELMRLKGERQTLIMDERGESVEAGGKT